MYGLPFASFQSMRCVLTFDELIDDGDRGFVEETEIAVGVQDVFETGVQNVVVGDRRAT